MTEDVYYKNVPLVADLDGTLLLTDMLHESSIAFIAHYPHKFYNILRWLRQGEAYLKGKLATHTHIDIRYLPYNEPLLDFLRQEHQRGRTLVLCTATHESIAQKIAEHLGIFSQVMATQGSHNLLRKNKADALVAAFGEKSFDYVGNSQDDVIVWTHARHAIVVNAPAKVLEQAKKVCEVTRIYPPFGQVVRTTLRAMRVHQWLKNLLLFIPALAAHQLFHGTAFASLLLAFVVFSLCASSVYIINDLLDIGSDRQHDRKKHRPLAAGTLSIQRACVLAGTLILSTVFFSLALSFYFLCTLLLYFMLTLAYSLWLKQLLLLDCITLAILYTLRIVAGGAVLQVALSPWLLTFSIFLFLSLAFVKRYAELYKLVGTKKEKACGRSYTVRDLPLVQTFGIVSAYTSVLVMALYLNSDIVVTLYTQPILLWFSIPILLYWCSWMWIQAHRGHMREDPVLYAIKDRVSLACGAVFAVVFFMASYL